MTNTIKMNGLPFMLQGWNTYFHISDEMSEDAPVYKMEGYNLYWLIPILPVKIMKSGGYWKMFYSDPEYLLNLGLSDETAHGEIMRKTEISDSPLGNWITLIEAARATIT